MSPGSEHRKVLIVEDDAAIRNVLYVLLAGVGCEGDIAYSGKQALAMIRRQEFDAVLLDLRCTNLQADEVFTQIQQVRPSLVGRVLVITGELTDPKTLELVEQYCLPHVPSNRLMQDLWGRLRNLFNPNRPPKTVV
jgi:DNA-binding NtrC family response regulator